MPRKVGELFFEMRASGEKLEQDLKEGERQFNKFAEYITANPLAAASGLGIAIAGIGYQAAQAAAAVDREFGKATRILGATREQADGLRADLRGLAHDAGESQDTIAGLFVTIAEGGPGGAANMHAMADAALALGKAFGADFGTAANGLDNITDIFGIDPARAREVAAIVFDISRGRVPLQDVLDVIAKIGPAAQENGIAFETVAGAVTALLDQGQNAKQAAGSFKELASNGAEGRAELERMAGASKSVSESMLALDAAVAEAESSIVARQERIRNQLRNTYIDLGRSLEPALLKGLAFVQGFLQGGTSAADRLTGALVNVAVAMDEVGRKGERVSSNGARSAADLLGLNTGGPSLRRGADAGPLFGAFPAADAGAGLSDQDLLKVGQRIAELSEQVAKAEKLSVPKLRSLLSALKDLLSSASTEAQRSKLTEMIGKVGDAISTKLGKAAKDAKDAEDKIKKSLEAIGEQIDGVMRDFFLDQDTNAAKVSKELLGESATRDANNKTLREQIVALSQSKEAYEQLLVTQAQAIAVAEMEAKAKAAGIILDKDAVPRLKAQIAATMSLTKVRDELLSKKVADPLNFDGIGELAQALSLMASASAQVASSFGKAGQRLAQMIGQAAQLTSSLSQAQRAGIFTEEVTGQDGTKSRVERNVGFLGALQGKAGLAGVATGVSSAIAVVGAVAGIADSLDLFGNRARERARLLRERAIAFNAALEDFAIVQRTSLDEQLRQNYANATQVASQAGFGGASFRSASDIDALAASLRAAADDLAERSRSAANGMRGSAAQLDKLAATARENEEKLREANRSALARLTDDLSVRRVALALGKDAGDQERDRLALLRQEEEIKAQYGDMAAQYIADLKAITAAEQALAAATAQRASVLQRLQDDNDVLGGTAQQRLQRSVGAMRNAFGDAVEGLFDGIDLSSSEGLEAGRQAIRDLYTRLAADGIDESERPLVDFLKKLLGDLDAAVGELPEHLAELTTRLEAWDESVRLFGHTFEEQLAQMQTVLAGKFGDEFDALLGGLDIGSESGRTESKGRIEGMLAGILNDGEISDTERPLYEMLQRLLGIINGAITKAGEEAEAAAAEEEEKAERARMQRATRRQRTQERNELFGVEGADAVRANIDAVDDAFSALFAQFDLETLAGIEGAQGTLRGLYDEIRGLSDDEVVRKFGQTRDEIISAILSTNDGLGGLATALAQVEAEATKAAQASADLAYRIGQDYLRSQGRNQEADLADAKRQRDESKKAAEEAGLGEQVLKQIEDTFLARVRDINKRYAEEAAKALAEQVQAQAQGSQSGTASNGSASSNANTTTAARRTSTTITSSLGGLSEVTGQSLAGIMKLSESYHAITARSTAGMYDILRAGLPAPPLSLLVTPTITSSSAGGGVSIVVQSLIVQVSGVRADGMTPEEAGQRAGRAALQTLGDEARARARYLGPATRQGIN